MPGRQPTASRRLWPFDHLAQAVCRPPMFLKPGKGIAVGRAELQDCSRHRQQRVQIERTGRLRPTNAAARACRASARARNWRARIRHPVIVRFRRDAGCVAARLKMSSSMTSKSSCQGMTPDPRAAVAKSATVSSGPPTVRWWYSQTGGTAAAADVVVRGRRPRRLGTGGSAGGKDGGSAGVASVSQG